MCTAEFLECSFSLCNGVRAFNANIITKHFDILMMVFSFTLESVRGEVNIFFDGLVFFVSVVFVVVADFVSLTLNSFKNTWIPLHQ